MLQDNIKNVMEGSMIPVDMVKPNPWNPNKLDKKKMGKIREDILQNGFIDPITVRRVFKSTLPGREELDYYQIIDGEHRWTIMKELGAKEIPAAVVDLDDTQAKLKTIQLNYQRGVPIPVKLAEVLHDLNKTMTLDELELALPYEKHELRDNLDLLKLPAGLDRQVEAKAAKERKEEPIFISAVIHKDKKKSLYNFIEQAMLASEATFCEVKIKIECPAGNHDITVEAIQNLAKADLARQDLNGEEAPMIIRFATYPEQIHIIDQAIDHVITTEAMQDNKNPRGRALELICADYLAGAQPLPEPLPERLKIAEEPNEKE
jgi:ParB/RepB/Spo0J family partition protein